MTRGVETQRISLCELRRSCVELTGKTGAREDAVELGNRFGGGTQRDVVFSRFGAACAENLLERFLDGFAGARDARADAAQSGGGLIADFTVRQDRAANRRKRLAEIHKRHGAGGKQRKLGRFFAKLLFEPARYF